MNQSNKNMPHRGKKQMKKPNQSKSSKPMGISRSSRSQAIRASRRNHDDAHQIASRYLDAEQNKKPSKRANLLAENKKVRIFALGGMDGGGSKNLIVVEYEDDAVIIDCGNNLGVDLPGVNFTIADTSYLKEIKHKIKAYIITHGHLDHIGALPYVMPEYPAPVYGSRFTIGMVEKIFENSDHKVKNFNLESVILNQDTHQKIRIGKNFGLELVRVTHSIPGCTVVVLDTPLGKIINTGDFRIDPEPLDHLPTDIKRLEEIGKEGVLVLMSDSTTAERPGRTPTESTLEPSFHDIFQNAPGRVFVAVFSSNISRIQMLVNAAVEDGRKIAIDGRSMITTLELAVNLGFIKIPKGTFVPMANVGNMKNEDVVVICTGSQGEPNSALMRMAAGDHKYVKMQERDTVILSSTPIPETGNDAGIGRMVDDLVRKGVHVFRHATRKVDGCGPLHVSGHASLEEYGDMIDFVKPKFFVPIYGAFRAKQYHIEEAVKRGIPRDHTINADNGEVMEFTSDKMKVVGNVPNGTVLIDNTGAIVSTIVAKDRLMMAQEGLVAVILTVSKKSGKLLSSPDIITRGFIYMRENEELMENFRVELKRVVQQRYGRVDLDRFKQELKDHVTYYLFGETQRSPIIIPVVNVVNGVTDLNKQQTKRTEMLNETSHS